MNVGTGRKPAPTSILLGIIRKDNHMNKNVNIFPAGNPDDTKSEAFRVAYKLAKKQGDKRFGSECKHENVKDGVCQQCLRKVI
jgi:hypothetical protein